MDLLTNFYILNNKAPANIDTILKVAFCLEGRDKITKIMQYGSRAIAWYFFILNPKSDVAKAFRNLFKAFQQSRKAFRLGKSLTYYTKAKRLFEDKSLEPWIKKLSILQNIGMFGFFACDNLVFLSSSKFIKLNKSKINNRGGRMWFVANIAAFILALTALYRDIEKEITYKNLLVSEQDMEQTRYLQVQIKKLKQGRIKKVLSVIKISCDILVSSNVEGVQFSKRLFGSKINDGIIGVLGCLSASTVLYNTWPELKK